MKLLDKILGVKADKRAFRDYRRRVDALPTEYNIVMNEIQAYLWSGGPGVLDGGLDMLYDVLALFESAAAEGREALAVTGDDVIAFCDELVRQWRSRTWQGDMREKFNKRIHKKLEALKNDDN
jgi:DNA-binding ferritin-like protein (Dps family)